MIQLKPGLHPILTLEKRPLRPGAAKVVARRKRAAVCGSSGCLATRRTAPFDQIEWEKRTAEITDDSGKVIFKQENIEVPKSWSALATKIAVSKYFYGDVANGTDPHKGGRETSVRQLVHRVTRTITDWGIADGYFANAETAETFYDELTWLCVNQHRRVQFAGLVQRRPLSSIRHRQGRGPGKLFLQPRDRRGGAGAFAIRISAGQRVLHPERGRHDGRHHAPRDERSDALQIWQRHGD